LAARFEDLDLQHLALVGTAENGPGWG
jgi:hypothetical protein